MCFTPRLYDVKVKVSSRYQFFLQSSCCQKPKNPPYLEGFRISGRGESNPRDLLGRQELYH